MSTMTSVITPSKVHMLTDAAVYDMRTGVLTYIGPKAFRIGSINAAFSSRGPGAVNLLLEKYLDALPLQSFDHFRREHVERTAAEIAEMVKALMPGRGYEVMVAGWSDEAGAGQVLFWHTHGKCDFLPVNTIGLFTEGIISFGTNDDAFGNLPENPEDFDPVTHALPAIEDARRTQEDIGCGELPEPVMGYSIGGHVLLTTVNRHGVEREIIHEWPDVVGQKINPL